MEPKEYEESWDERIKPRVREVWPLIQDEDLETISAKQESLCSLIQEKYGFSKSEADRRINQILLEIQGRPYL